MKTSICSGSVIHNRITPKAHRFQYKMSWCLFDLDRLEETFKKTRFWSFNSFNIVSIRNNDYINAENISIKSKVIKYLKEQKNYNFNGQVFLFTHPRYLGFGFNSVNFYFCYEGDNLVFILSEINNTPWKQKHVYIHAINQEKTDHSESYQFEFNKEFHISPFADMDINYSWIFNVTPEKLIVKMNLSKQNNLIMKVNLNTRIEPVIEKDLVKWTFKKPYQALKMSVGIYWQAFKLWAKKLPVYTNPKSKEIEP
ncbi:MAG: DUF1365 domain-containing protein [Marinicellaceae bacterium]